MAKEKPWLPSAEDNAKHRGEFVRHMTEEGTDLFNPSTCAGYWMAGVAWDSVLGWLGYEYEADGAGNWTTICHSDVIDLWKNGKGLPPLYHAISPELVGKAYDIGSNKWGLSWTDRIDTDGSFYDCVIQWALFGQIKYS